MSERKQIRNLLEVDGRLPFLFVGSGLSLRYLGLPNWEGLLRKFAEMAGLEFDFLLATHTEGKLEEVATSIGERFTELWFKSNEEAFEELRAKFPGKVKARGLALKYGVADYLREKADLAYEDLDSQDNPYREELDLLRKIRIEGLVTTNYDNFLEKTFPDFVTYVGQQELLFSNAHFVGEIYKIHGSVIDPPSIVLDDEDYQDFSRKNIYLVSKLLTIFAERPVIFLGYSINDAYVQEILSNLVAVAEGGYLDRLSDRLIFVQWNPTLGEEIVVTKHHFPAGETNLPMTKVETNSFSWLYEILGELERGISAAEVRQIQAQVYAAVRERVDAGNVPEFRVVDLNEATDTGIRTIFGFTLGSFESDRVENIGNMVSDPIGRLGYRGLRLDDLINDVILESGNSLDPKHVLEETIPTLPSSANAPIAKYLVAANWIDRDGNLIEEHENQVIQDHFHRRIDPPVTAVAAFRRGRENGESFTLRELLHRHDLGISYRLSFPLLLDVTSFKAEELLEYILEIKKDPETEKYSTYLRKLVSYYDRLNFLPNYRERRLSEVEDILAGY